METIVNISHLAQGQTPPEGKDLDLLVSSWEYALEGIPTQHLEALFRRAMAAKRDDYPFSAVAMNREWDTMLGDLREQAAAHQAQTARLLEAGRGSLGQMKRSEFKMRHNLPDNWKLGEPYPPESDLYGKPVPAPHQDGSSVYTGEWDARWYWGKWRTAPQGDASEIPF